MNHFKLAVLSAFTIVTWGLSAPAFACGPGSDQTGCEPPPPPPPPPVEEPVKGNNGWGNGPDTTNAGSFSGKTAVTKSVNGPANGKFTGR